MQLLSPPVAISLSATSQVFIRSGNSDVTQMNRGLKRILEKGLRGAGVAAALRATRQSGILVLAYHNIVPEDEDITGDLSLHLPQREFARQLDWLRRTHDVVPLDAILGTPPAGARPRAVITFDDAYGGAVKVGTRELADRDLPATIFVAPAFIGCNGFWWDRLAPTRGGVLPSNVREHCIDALAGRNDLVMAWAAERNMMVRPVPPHQHAATEDELAACAVSGRITFATHTWSHPNLNRIADADLPDELEQPLAWLRARFSQVIPWLAYPYGIASTSAADAARAAGYEGALLVRGGKVARQDANRDRFMLPRLNIPAALSLDGFALRASGLSPHSRDRWTNRLL